MRTVSQNGERAGAGLLLMLLVADADHARRSEWVVVPSHRFGHVEIPLIL
jgi:hypothetical protein